MREILKDAGLEAKAGGSLMDNKVEIFPKQYSVGEGRCGNQVWLPLAGKSVPLRESLIEDGYRDGKREDAKGLIWPLSKEVEKRTKPERKTGSGPTAENPVECDAELAEIWSMLESLKFDNEEKDDFSYQRWMDIGFALNHGLARNDKGREMWSAWSCKGASASGPGDESIWAECEYKWSTMGLDGNVRNAITLDTLRFLSRQVRRAAPRSPPGP